MSKELLLFRNATVLTQLLIETLDEMTETRFYRRELKAAGNRFLKELEHHNLKFFSAAELTKDNDAQLLFHEVVSAWEDTLSKFLKADLVTQSAIILALENRDAAFKFLEENGFYDAKPELVEEIKRIYEEGKN